MERETTRYGFPGKIYVLLHAFASLTLRQGIIMFLQSLPTQEWTDHDVELLLSEAFLLNSVWHHAQSHFNGK